MPNKFKKNVETKSRGQKPVRSSSKVRAPPDRKKSKEVSLAKEKAAIAAMSRLSHSRSNVLDWSLAEHEGSLTRSRRQSLAVEGVYFRCPAISSEILTRKEWKNKIRHYLQEQLLVEKGITSCLMIHTLTPDKDKVEQCVETLCTYLTNLLLYPNDDKYKKIRMSNKNFQSKVYPIEGAIDFLIAAGFKQKIMSVDENAEEYLIFDERQYNREHLEILIEAVRSTEPIHLEVYRNPAVLLAEQAANRTELPDDFYTYTRDDLQKEQKLRQQQQLDSLQLRTKAMREREELKALKKYKYSLIRVRFPDGTFLQGTFGVFEKFREVREFIREHLYAVGDFSLLNSLGKIITNADDNLTLFELKLVPAVLLTFVSGHDRPLPHYLKTKMLRKIMN